MMFGTDSGDAAQHISGRLKHTVYTKQRRFINKYDHTELKCLLECPLNTSLQLMKNWNIQRQKKMTRLFSLSLKYSLTMPNSVPCGCGTASTHRARTHCYKWITRSHHFPLRRWEPERWQSSLEFASQTSPKSQGPSLSSYWRKEKLSFFSLISSGRIWLPSNQHVHKPEINPRGVRMLRWMWTVFK